MHHHQQAQSVQAAQQAAEERRRREEEEVLTAYSEVEMEQDWQFKIVRGDFRTLEKVQAVMDEQAEWGWVFVEKFDNARVRFKRPASEAEQDVRRDGNPYSTKSEAAKPGCGTAAALLLMIGVGSWLISILA